MGLKKRVSTKEKRPGKGTNPEKGEGHPKRAIKGESILRNMIGAGGGQENKGAGPGRQKGKKMEQLPAILLEGRTSDRGTGPSFEEEPVSI